MTPERWARVQSVFAGALEQSPHDRARFLKDSCDGDSVLRQEVESLLASHDSVSSEFLGAPADRDAGQALAPGGRVGAYEILGPIGRGGMGEVYRARDRKLDRDVAIKVLPAHLSSSPAAHSRFEREAKAVAALSHPNILSIFDFGFEGGIAYAVTELLQGETLRAKLEIGPMSTRTAVDYALQMAKGLAAAHERGIVHRDLKPENIFVSKDGHLKILDFGLAKREEKVAPGEETSAPTASGQTEPGTVMGTVGYMSPEQVRAITADHRSDVFSFGAILYEMLAGRRAFRKDTAGDTLAAILRDEPAALPLGTPVFLDRVVRHCLEKDRDNRFQSARDIVFALAEESSLPPSIVRAPAPRRPTLGRLLAIGAASLAVAIGALVWMRQRSPATPPTTSIAVLPFTNMSADKDQDYFSDGLTEEVMGLLTKVRGLRVMGRTSSFAFRGKTDDVEAIGRKLHVSAILEGSVRRVGDRIRVAAQLVNVSDGFQVWAETYDRSAADIYAVQDAIAASVVGALKVELAHGESVIEPDRRTSNSEAYNLYLLGRQLWNRQTPENYRRAVDAFRRAVALDPGFGAAYAGLARSVAMDTQFNSTNSAERDRGRREALELAEKAVLLEPTLTEALFTRGWLRYDIGWDWSGAQADLTKALERDPNDPDTLRGEGTVLAALGRLPEAIATMKKATAVDPLQGQAYFRIGTYLTASGELKAARDAFQKAFEINPENPWVPYHTGVNALLDRNPTRALSDFNRAKAEWQLTGQVLAQYELGRKAEAEQALKTLVDKYGFRSAYFMAEIYARRGDKDGAFEWLDRAYTQRDRYLTWIKFDPLLAGLRDDHRYAAVLKKMNLPPGPAK